MACLGVLLACFSPLFWSRLGSLAGGSVRAVDASNAGAAVLRPYLQRRCARARRLPERMIPCQAYDFGLSGELGLGWVGVFFGSGPC
jgi:hypothetical protein